MFTNMFLKSESRPVIIYGFQYNKLIVVPEEGEIVDYDRNGVNNKIWNKKNYRRAHRVIKGSFGLADLGVYVGTLRYFGSNIIYGREIKLEDYKNNVTFDHVDRMAAFYGKTPEHIIGIECDFFYTGDIVCIDETLKLDLLNTTR